jgi:hypothetical protein
MWRVFLSRLLAPWIAGLSAWLAVKFGAPLTDEQQEKMVEFLVGIVIPFLLTVYGAAHKLISHATNPGDAASGTLARQEKEEQKVLKESEAPLVGP